MLNIAQYKHITEERPITKVPLPRFLYLPLRQHLGNLCETHVKDGETVECGQCVGMRSEGLFSPIHIPAGGKVIRVCNWPHPEGQLMRSVVVEVDEELQGRLYEPKEGVFKKMGLSAGRERVLERIFEAGIVGMGGAGFPTHIKLNPPREIDTFILNGAECEPFLSADYRLMVERTKEIIFGLWIIKRLLEPENIYIGVEQDKHAAIKAFNNMLSMEKELNAKVVKLPTSYPQGAEKQIINSITGRIVPACKLPYDVGVVVSNVATVYAIQDALLNGRPLTGRIVTVAGDCLENPLNLEVPIGIRIGELLEYCGSFLKKPAKIIMGGPMMGFTQSSLYVPVLKTTSGILALSEDVIDLKERTECIRCAKCVDACPMRLIPAEYVKYVEAGRTDILSEYHINDCIECGNCAYVCPAKIPIVQLIKLGKQRLRDES